MRKFGKLVGRVFLAMIVIAIGMWWFGPYEDNDLSADFESRKFGEGVQVYFESIESRFKDITPGSEKRVIWTGQRETRTPYSVVYLHGYSATSEEIRPVPDLIAKALGATLFTPGFGAMGAMAKPWPMPPCLNGCMTQPKLWPPGAPLATR